MLVTARNTCRPAYMYLHAVSHLEDLSSNSTVSTTQETSGAGSPFLSPSH